VRAARAKSCLTAHGAFLPDEQRGTATLQLQLAGGQEATSAAAADRLLRNQPFEMLLIALDIEGTSVQLLNDLRDARHLSNCAIRVAVLTRSCDGELIGHLRAFQVR